VKHKDDFDGLGTAVVPALKVLVYYHPEEYRDYARSLIDRWYNELGYHDPEYWWGLIIAVYPEHPVTEELFEQQENYAEVGLAIRLGDENAKVNARANILSHLEEGEIYWVSQMLENIPKGISTEILSLQELNQIEAAFLKIAEKDVPFDNPQIKDWTAQHSIIGSAITMNWQKVLNALSRNANYLSNALYLFEASSANEILYWSLTENHELVENMAFQLQSKSSAFNKIHQISFPSHGFALAIAWIRSQSKKKVDRP
jgi:hypothetical protein